MQNSLAPKALETVDILGVKVHSVTRAELLSALTRGVLFTPNVDFIMRMRVDPEFREMFHRADFRICDSRIVQLAAKFLGTPIKEKIAGSDFFGEFCDHHRENPEMTVFLLGAAPGVALEAQRRLNLRCGRNMVVGAHSPSFGFEKNPQECEELIQRVEQSGATVLAVGVGAPKQEKWIIRHKDRLPGVKIFMGIGATIDFEAGNVSRAPVWTQNLGLEWVYRLIKEPRRLWRRYLLDDMPFLWLIIKQRLKMNTSPRDARDVKNPR